MNIFSKYLGQSGSGGGGITNPLANGSAGDLSLYFQDGVGFFSSAGVDTSLLGLVFTDQSELDIIGGTDQDQGFQLMRLAYSTDLYALGTVNSHSLYYYGPNPTQGALYHGTDGGFNIGLVTDGRPNNVYVKTNVAAGGNILLSGTTSNGHALFPGHGNIGCTDATSGTDYRASKAFLSSAVLVGNVLGFNPPYGLNNVLFTGMVGAGNATSVATVHGSNTLFNSVSMGFHGFGKDASFTNAPAFINLDNVSDNNVYFSLLHRVSPRTDFMKFDASSGDFTTLVGKVIATAGLGVGNSAAASVAVGTLTGKMEVFNAAGVSLGFVPIYASIT